MPAKHWMNFVFLLVLALLSLSCFESTYTYDRFFVAERVVTPLKWYSITPKVTAFRASRDHDLESPSTFEVSVAVYTDDVTRATAHRPRMDTLFNIDSCLLLLVESNESHVLHKSHEDTIDGNEELKRVFHFRPAPLVPNDIDTIEVVFPFYGVDTAGKPVNRKPVITRMIRYEYRGRDRVK